MEGDKVKREPQRKADCPQMSDEECFELLENRELRKLARNPAIVAEKTASKMVSDYRVSPFHSSLYNRCFHFRLRSDTEMKRQCRMKS